MAEMYPAPPELMERITRLINAYHPHLRGARIKVETRQTVPTIQLAPTWAEVDTPNNDSQARQYDFYLWFARDAYDPLDNFQRDALVEHELCHCVYDDKGKPMIAAHSIEAFNSELERYGLWWNDSAATQAAIDIMQARRGRGEIAQMASTVQEGSHGSTGAGSHGSTGAGSHGSTGAGSHGSTGAGGAEDALIEKLRMLRDKLRAGGFSEIETGRLTDRFLSNWMGVISEGSHGSTGA